jgi:hypothetical protein
MTWTNGLPPLCLPSDVKAHLVGRFPGVLVDTEHPYLLCVETNQPLFVYKTSVNASAICLSYKSRGQMVDRAVFRNERKMLEQAEAIAQQFIDEQHKHAAQSALMKKLAAAVRAKQRQKTSGT